MKPMSEVSGLDSDVDAMIDAAFAVLAQRHPECESGDFTPDATVELRRALECAAEHWLCLNS